MKTFSHAAENVVTLLNLFMLEHMHMKRYGRLQFMTLGEAGEFLIVMC